jgi:hypothetical protein
MTVDKPHFSMYPAIRCIVTRALKIPRRLFMRGFGLRSTS